VCKELLVSGRIVGALLGGEGFVGNGEEHAVKEIVGAGVVVVKKCELGSDTVGDVCGDGVEGQVGG